MDVWAASPYSEEVAFVCVSCAGPQLAAKFGNDLRLRKCYNTWIEDEEDMPKWGQLGCSGFIVINGEDRIVCSATAAYLQVKEGAFSDVEKVLKKLLSFESAKRNDVKFQSGQVDTSIGSCAAVRFGSSAIEEPKAINLSGPIQSVKVQALDDEHEKCDTQLAQLEKVLSEAFNSESKRNETITQSLRTLLSVYSTHFKHEEDLLDKYLYSGVAQDNSATVGFSADKGARTSHFADHKSMLSDVHHLLENPSMVNATSVTQLRQNFQRHAMQYDGGYADRLSVAMAEA